MSAFGHSWKKNMKNPVKKDFCVEHELRHGVKYASCLTSNPAEPREANQFWYGYGIGYFVGLISILFGIVAGKYLL